MRKDRETVLKSKLHEWAEYEYLRNPHSSRTVESTAGEGRSPNKPGARIPKGVETPARIAKINQAVKQLGDFHPELQLVVILRYSRQPDGYPRKREMQLKTFHSVTKRGSRTFSEWLGKAHAWLDGRLA